MALRRRVTLQVTYDEFPFGAGETPWGWAQRVATELGYGPILDFYCHTETIDVTTNQDTFRRYLPGKEWAEIVADIRQTNGASHDRIAP